MDTELISIEQHNRSNNHDFNREAKFPNIKITRKDINIKK